MKEILELDVKKNLIIITHRHELVKTCNKYLLLRMENYKELIKLLYEY